jgi:hypothetical protein
MSFSGRRPEAMKGKKTISAQIWMALLLPHRLRAMVKY